MKRLLLFLLIVCSTSVFSQEKFAWITDSHIGFKGADKELSEVVNLINSFNDIDFVIASGDITEKGMNSELEKANSILSNLEKPLFIIPGNHDNKWSESGCTKFKEIWDDDKFTHITNNTAYIGINSSVTLRGGGGHFTPEDIKWLKEELDEIDSTKGIVLITHHPVNEDIDNWYELTNLLRNYNIKAVLNGHEHNNKILKYNGIPAAMGRSTLSQNKKSYGFTLVENSEDAMVFYEIEKDTMLNYWGTIHKNKKLNIPYQKTPKLKNNGTEIVWQKDLNVSLSAEPVYWNDRVYVVDYSGLLTCYDSSGTIVWDYDMFGDVISKPAIFEGVIAIATLQGDLVILDAKYGEQIQTIGFDETIIAPLKIFNYSGPQNLLMPKLTNSNAAIIISTATGEVICYDLETLQEHWRNDDAKGMIETEPIIIGNKLVYGCWDSHLYCIDNKTGNTIWQWKASDSFYYSPAVCEPVTDGKNLYITTPEKFLYAIDLRQGVTVWKKKNYNGWESIGISKDKRKLFVKSYKDHFHIVSAVTTDWVRDINMKFGIDTNPTTPIEWQDNILFSGKNGNIYKIDKDNKFKSLLFLGTARTHSVQQVGYNKFIASNMDGQIVVFKLYN
ncbi:MAG: PQQ-binding-like beta-propeller repeat protein [Bacteroidota bacterium]